MSKVICCVGLVCIDMVNVCRGFPEEDTDQRSQSLHWQRGGNAGNSSVTLALLGSNVDFIGTVPDCQNTDSSWGSTALRLALDDLERHGVGLNHVVCCSCKEFPTSTVIVNSKNGSRTIRHSRGSLPELAIEDLRKLDLNRYCWIHFEGRSNIDVIVKAMEMIKNYNDQHQPSQKVVISVEFEKVREHSGDRLGPAKIADVVFISKDFALHMGWESSLQAVEGMKPYLSPESSVICTWGSGGPAFGTNSDADVGRKVSVRSPEKIVDTLGAGDAFIGGVLHSMSEGRSLEESVEFGCRIAERKITGFAFDHIGGMTLGT